MIVVVFVLSFLIYLLTVCFLFFSLSFVQEDYTIILTVIMYNCIHWHARSCKHVASLWRPFGCWWLFYFCNLHLFCIAMPLSMVLIHIQYIFITTPITIVIPYACIYLCPLKSPFLVSLLFIIIMLIPPIYNCDLVYYMYYMHIYSWWKCTMSHREE